MGFPHLFQFLNQTEAPERGPKCGEDIDIAVMQSYFFEVERKR